MNGDLNDTEIEEFYNIVSNPEVMKYIGNKKIWSKE
jgi:hypothetical protein